VTTGKAVYAAFNFLIDLGEKKGIQGGFQEVIGLKTGTENVRHRAGADPVVSRKSVGVKQQTVTLKRGMIDAAAFARWRESLKRGAAARRTITLTLVNEAHATVQMWRLRSTWIQKLQAPTLNAKTGEVAIEDLTLVHEGIELV
jgi:phage tail-like protein